MELNNIYSPYKILYHIDKVRESRPVFVQWDITNRCNLNCPHCSSRLQSQYCFEDEWKFENLKRVAYELKGYGIKAIEITGGGEPLIHPDFIKIAKLFLSLGFKIGLVTNGTLINKQVARIIQKFEWVRVSIDERDDFNYGLIEVIRKEGCVLGSSFVIKPANFRKILTFARKMKEVGFDNCRFTVLYPNGGKLLKSYLPRIRNLLNLAKKIEEENYSVFIPKERLIDVWKKKRDYSACYYSRLVSVIAGNGKIYWCCATKNEPYALIGNLNKESFAEILDKKQDPDISKCPFCWMDKKNEIVEELLNNPHKEFI